MLSSRWEKMVKKVDFAFQPIVSIQSGEIYAVEALLRNVKDAGFHSIFNFFDEAFSDNVLYQLDLSLRLKAFEKFSKIDIDELNLFYNIDNRLLYMLDFRLGNTDKILKKLDIDKKKICFELSERGTLQDPSSVTNMVTRYKQEEFKIAIDDFGTGVAGFQMLYYSEADYIKIDRFFIQNIQNDNKKRLFCSRIIDIAHIMGISVIAEGIETKEEYYTCLEIGADFAQGYFIQKPKKDIKEILPVYDNIKKLYEKNLRSNKANRIDEDKIEYIEPIYIEELNFHTIFKYFKKYKNYSFVPIIDKYRYIVGVLFEEDIRYLSYSQYGMSLACNCETSIKLKNHLRKFVSVDIGWSVDKILEIYNANKNVNKGLFVTNSNKYYGFLSLQNLLYLSYKRNLEIATEKNPLTKLDGNRSIDRFFMEAFKKDRKNIYTFIYFDFNNFKQFNDLYGFRNGDRAILLFRDIFKKYIDKSSLIAHIGGDDFFAGFIDVRYKKIYDIASVIMEKFKEQASSLYSQKDREAGYIVTKDRFGIERKFDLLSVAAAIIEIHPGNTKKELDNEIGKIKKVSKLSSKPVGVCFV